MCARSVTESCPTLCDPMDVAHQVPLSMEFLRKEYWCGLPFPSGDLSGPVIKPASPPLAGGFLPLLGKPLTYWNLSVRVSLELSCLNLSPFPSFVILCKLSNLWLLFLICKMRISVILPYMAVMKGEHKLMYIEQLEECPIHRKHSTHNF